MFSSQCLFTEGTALTRCTAFSPPPHPDSGLGNKEGCLRSCSLEQYMAQAWGKTTAPLPSPPRKCAQTPNRDPLAGHRPTVCGRPRVCTATAGQTYPAETFKTRKFRDKTSFWALAALSLEATGDLEITANQLFGVAFLWSQFIAILILLPSILYSVFCSVSAVYKGCPSPILTASGKNIYYPTLMVFSCDLIFRPQFKNDTRLVL